MTKRKQGPDPDRIRYDIRCWRKWIREAHGTALHLYSCGGPGWAPNLTGFSDTDLILGILGQMVDRLQAKLDAGEWS